MFIVFCTKIHHEKADFQIPIKYAPFGGFRGLKKNSPLIPVRIEVLCFYTFFENFKFLAFAKTLLNTPHLGSCSAVNSLFFLVPGSDFRPAGVKISYANALKSESSAKSHRFFKILQFYCVC